MAGYMDSVRALMRGKLTDEDKKKLRDAKQGGDPKKLGGAVKKAVDPLAMFRKK